MGDLYLGNRAGLKICTRIISISDLYLSGIQIIKITWLMSLFWKCAYLASASTYLHVFIFVADGIMTIWIEWGSEIWSSLDFELSKTGWVANGLDFKWDLKSGSQTINIPLTFASIPYWSNSEYWSLKLRSKMSGIQMGHQVTWLYHLNTVHPYC